MVYARALRYDDPCVLERDLTLLDRSNHGRVRGDEGVRFGHLPQHRSFADAHRGGAFCGARVQGQADLCIRTAIYDGILLEQRKRASPLSLRQRTPP